jgi:NADH-quinone oxidoreductase subunit L
VARPNFSEAIVFFITLAAVGGFTILLAASQALVAKELKKALAYSTISCIGYMMLALGVAGMSSNNLVEGFSAAIFFLINHGVFKAALFLGAGVVIHESGSIYMSEMRMSRRRMRFTWLFMGLAGLSLMGVPPFAGFWSKDSVLVSCWQAGQYGLFAIALGSVVLTAFYVIRFMGIMFSSEQALEAEGKYEKEASALELAPIGLLAALTVAVGLIGPWFSNALSNVFETYFTQTLSHPLIAGTGVTLTIGAIPLEAVVAVLSSSMIVFGLIPAYRLYVSQKISAEAVVSKHPTLKAVHSFLWNRWHIEAFYNKVFVNGVLIGIKIVPRFVERPLDQALNVEVPRGFAGLHRSLKKVQTGVLSVNMLYLIGLIVVLLFLRLEVL